ncbi:MAG: DIP1984 family protein, partial [Erysipelotrichaceae bacterium]|nr:DIP1984 family protein [Erysipelotrichaceae bacterium]
FKQYNDGLKQLEELIIMINLTNSRAKVEGVTLTELIARRDTLKQKIDAYRSVLSTASSNTSRATRTEIKVLSTINVESFQKDVDRMSKELRELDNKIQEANWKIELK